VREWLPGPALLLGALAVNAFLARPAQREAQAVRAEAARLREDEGALKARSERRERDLSRAAVPAESRDGLADPVARLRTALLAAVATAPVSGVRLSVGPAEGALEAEGRLRAEGAFPDLVRLSGRLAAPLPGFVLKRVRLSTSASARGGLVLELEGATLREPTP
jgi:hypothetical protein